MVNFNHGYDRNREVKSSFNKTTSVSIYRYPQQEGLPFQYMSAAQIGRPFIGSDVNHPSLSSTLIRKLDLKASSRSELFFPDSHILLNDDNTKIMNDIKQKQPDPIGECDFDVNPTSLYLAIINKKWEEALNILNSEDDDDSTGNEAEERGPKNDADISRGKITHQSAIWVVRKELDGKLRWRLLPIHVAIFFGAPLCLVEPILQSYPLGSKCKDDQGMLPLHLAFRHDASDDVLQYLLTSYPDAIFVKDRKGRTPIECATKGQKGKNYEKALLISRFSEITSHNERKYWIKIANNMHEKQMSLVKYNHCKEKTKLKQAFDEQSQNQINKIRSLHVALEKSVSAKKSLERQVNTLTANEYKLIEKIQELTNTLNECIRESDERKQETSTQIEKIKQENLCLRDKVDELEACNKNLINATSNDFIDMHASRRTDTVIFQDKIEKRHDTVSRNVSNHKRDDCNKNDEGYQSDECDPSEMPKYNVSESSLERGMLDIFAKQGLEVTKDKSFAHQQLMNMVHRRAGQILEALKEGEIVNSPSQRNTNENLTNRKIEIENEENCISKIPSKTSNPILCLQNIDNSIGKSDWCLSKTVCNIEKEQDLESTSSSEKNDQDSMKTTKLPFLQLKSSFDLPLASTSPKKYDRTEHSHGKVTFKTPRRSNSVDLDPTISMKTKHEIPKKE